MSEALPDSQFRRDYALPLDFAHLEIAQSRSGMVTIISGSDSSPVAARDKPTQGGTSAKRNSLMRSEVGHVYAIFSAPPKAVVGESASNRIGRIPNPAVNFH